MMSPSQRILRRALRSARRALTPQLQRRHARFVARQLRQLPLIRTARRIAYYLARDGELDPSVIRQQLARRHQRWYLPIVRPFGPRRLWFVPHQLGERLQRGRLGILQPRRRYRPVTAHQLDVILLPVVGFDASGQRLGMGGGYYDRTLAYLHRRNWRRPHLIGIAHEVQRVPQLIAQPWDVAMEMIVTDAGCSQKCAQKCLRTTGSFAFR